MTKTLLRGGRLIDPATRIDARLDLLVVDGRIAARGESLAADEGTRVIDVAGLVVAPGLVDIHVHLRDPGRQDEETIATGGAAAAHGGVTSLAAMPNTEPAIDTPSWVEYVRTRESAVHVHPIAAITVGRSGKALTEMVELAQAGAVAFSDDGNPVANAAVMRRALEYSILAERPLVSHCEDQSLSAGGLMHEGLASTIAGLRGIPAAAEEIAVARDLILARTTGAKLHVAHVSTREAVELVRRAKGDGIAVTCETCPHYFCLTDQDVRSYDTNLKVNPPLRSADDVAAVKAGLADGTIDAIASDHAPHSREEKEVEFEAAPPGMIGLETLLPLALTHLVHPGVISLGRAVELLSTDPATILSLPAGGLAVGSPADVVVFDPGVCWTVEREWLRSKSGNSPFLGRTLTGRAVLTVVRGEVAFEDEAWSRARNGGPGKQGARGERELPLHT